MNPYELNGKIGSVARIAICKSLNIEPTEIYKVVKSIGFDGIVTTKEGKEYILILKEKK
jgi:hypothetical protein